MPEFNINDDQLADSCAILLMKCGDACFLEENREVTIVYL